MIPNSCGPRFCTVMTTVKGTFVDISGGSRTEKSLAPVAKGAPDRSRFAVTRRNHSSSGFRLVMQSVTASCC